MATSGGPLLIDHVGIAVLDLDRAVADFAQRLGVAPERRERVAADGVEAVFFALGLESVELLGSTRPDSSIARFLERRGEGIHHLAFSVADIAAELRHWEEAGAQLIDSQPRLGSRGRLVAFIHPQTEHGVLTELCQRAPGPR